MNETEPQSREVVTDRLQLDSGDVERASHAGFRALVEYHIDVVTRVPGFEEGPGLAQDLGQAADLYDIGEYEESLILLRRCVRALPALRPFLFYYMRVCTRVLATPSTPVDDRYAARLGRYRSMPRWFRWLIPTPAAKIRCKWCGRYTPFIHPNTPTFGIDASANSCRLCGRMYPGPSWLWDSPTGRAYSYYRGSFADDGFYAEFERDYEAQPRTER